MLNYAAFAIVFAILSIGIPHTVASLVGGSVGLALAHAFEAAYIARTVISPITSGLKKISDGVASLAKGSGRDGSGEEAAIQTVLAQHQRRSSADAAASAATTVLNPFTGKPRPYNGPDPLAAGPSLPPPGSGPGGGAAQLGYQPGRPGQHTKDIAVDVTDLQARNGSGNS